MSSGSERIEPLAAGRPGYHPCDLLKLYLHGYLNRVQSSRRLEREAGRNVEVMWLSGRLVPDHKTIADFRKDNGPRTAAGRSATSALGSWRYAAGLSCSPITPSLLICYFGRHDFRDIGRGRRDNG